MTMNFLEIIFDRLQKAANSPVLGEVRDGKIVSVTGSELLELTEQARMFFVDRGLKRGDRCALIAPNGIRWVALDLALLAEGITVVPLYSRQVPAELVGMLKDSTPARICCTDATLAAEVQKLWPAAPKISLLDSIFLGDKVAPTPALSQSPEDPLAIIYTSGTSGEPKGVVLTAANLNFMLQRTGARLDDLMALVKKQSGEPERIFHYAPFCFAASWILLLSALSRNSLLTLSTDLSKLSEELKLAAPDYFLNVPTLLERVRAKIEEAVQKRGGFTATIFSHARDGYARRRKRQGTLADSIWFALANTFMFPTIRKTIGANLKALICGSAPLSVDTQLFFMMLGIPVLQVYGLTETTAICTMDDPHSFEPGYVGRAIPGVEMSVGESGEILVRGPNIFSGYWRRPEETAKAMDGGWFHTGDQGEVDSEGNWRISGRLKNLIILNSGHNIAPEPLEDALASRLPEAAQVVLVGNQRSFLAALITTQSSNGLAAERIQAAIDAANAGAPHYKTIRAFHVVPEPLTIENGLLTANGKLKRDAIAARFAAEIEQLFQKKST